VHLQKEARSKRDLLFIMISKIPATVQQVCSRVSSQSITCNTKIPQLAYVMMTTTIEYQLFELPKYLLRSLEDIYNKENKLKHDLARKVSIEQFYSIEFTKNSLTLTYVVFLIMRTIIISLSVTRIQSTSRMPWVVTL